MDLGPIKVSSNRYGQYPNCTTYQRISIVSTFPLFLFITRLPFTSFLLFLRGENKTPVFCHPVIYTVYL